MIGLKWSQINIYLKIHIILSIILIPHYINTVCQFGFGDQCNLITVNSQNEFIDYLTGWINGCLFGLFLIFGPFLILTTVYEILKFEIYLSLKYLGIN
jgi:hypothetical protein